jgi:phosphoribosyl 1,2-cyclic phosphate phosphodiesterase
LKVSFLGTGTSQGIPIIGSNHPVCQSNDPRDKRLRSSVLVQWYDCAIVIDCGPDFRQQMLQYPISKLDAILFTHEHADHTAGIDDIRPFFFRQGDIPIYALPRVIDNLTQRFGYILNSANKYPGAPAVDIHRVDPNQSFSVCEQLIVPVVGQHNRLDVLGYRIESFAYLTDIKTISDDEIRKLHGLDVLVLNALRVEPHHSHLHLEEAIQLAQKIGARTTYFTHISHHLGFYAEVEQNLPKNVHLAYDNLTITI